MTIAALRVRSARTPLVHLHAKRNGVDGGEGNASGTGGGVHLLEPLLVVPSATKGGSSSHITVQRCVHFKTNPGPSAAAFHPVSQFVIHLSVGITHSPSIRTSDSMHETTMPAPLHC